MRRFALVAVLFAAACTKPEAPGPGPAEQPAAPAAGEAAEDGGSDLGPVDSVMLEPATPVAANTLQAKVTDARNRMLYFTWYVDGQEVVGEHADRLDGKYVKKGGRIAVEVIPTAGETEGEAKKSDEITVGNSAPRITSVDLVSGDAGQLVFKTNVEDVDGDSITYRLVSGPAGMAVGADGTVTWSAPQDFAGGVTFTVGASDGESEMTLENSIGSR